MITWGQDVEDDPVDEERQADDGEESRNVAEFFNVGDISFSFRAFLSACTPVPPGFFDFADEVKDNRRADERTEEECVLIGN